jgi:transcription elongation GreA/GreB family factor
MPDIIASLPAEVDDATVADLRRALKSTFTAKMRASKKQLEGWEDALSHIQELLRAAIVDEPGARIAANDHVAFIGGEVPLESFIDDEQTAADESPQ